MKPRRTWAQRMAAKYPSARFDSHEIYIYAYVSPSDVVVYVGRTWDPGTRHGAHRAKSSWWTPDLAFTLVEVCRGWDDAVAREVVAIRELAPVANIYHNRRAA